MKQPAFTSDYQVSAARATRELKTKTLLRALVSRLHTAFSDGAEALSFSFSGGAAPHILICDRAAAPLGRVTIDAETGLYVLCELGRDAANIVTATANENRSIEEIALHLSDGRPTQQACDTAIGSLVGQTLHHCGGDHTHTAFMLGMPLVTLCNKLALYFAGSVDDPPRAAAETGYGMKDYRLR
ncbi:MULTISPECIES: RNA polymerase subunit sigma-54 [unclassified Rhizobium]|uniref:RNA polymerase subunit sigma-54 n=1 Tax=unclassified Rhizobium TaxID=2613769 RepID=UPI00198022AC|nr:MULTISPECIES: RNA polymerase subunit sigma-54 [unclassified Rhizobium]